MKSQSISQRVLTTGFLVIIALLAVRGTKAEPVAVDGWGVPLVLDSSGLVGKYTSLAIVNGNPAVAYFDETNKNLKYVRANDVDGGSWGTPVTVDAAGDTGFYASLAVVDGRPAIAYYELGGKDLKYVRANDADGSGWGAPMAVDSVDQAGQYASLGVVDGYPAITYYDEGSRDLMYVRANDAQGTTWGAPVPVVSEGEVGLHCSMAVVGGYPAISYYNNDEDDLMYVRASDAQGTAWGTPVTVDETNSVGWYTSLVVVDGNPAISYYDLTDDDLKYVRANDTTGTSWGAPKQVDTLGDAGRYASMAVVDGVPAIAYKENDEKDLKYVQALDAVGSAWNDPVLLDVTGIVGEFNTILEVNGEAAVAYYDSSDKDLKYIRAGANIAQVGDLAAVTGDDLGLVNLSWTAPAAVATYEVRYHTEAITAANWDQATIFQDQLTANPPGTAEALEVDGLAPGPDYYFAILARDAEGNPAAVSNSPSAAAPEHGLYFAAVLVGELDIGIPPVTTTLGIKPLQGQSWTTDLTLQNTGSASGQVSLSYIDQNGSVAAIYQAPIQGNSYVGIDSKVDLPGLPANFSGSAVVSSNVPVVGVANLNNGTTSAAYSGITAGESTVYLPTAVCNVGGYNSVIAVQNIGAKNSTTLINYKAGNSGTGGTDYTSLDPGQTSFFDTSKKCAELSGTDDGFEGSASVMSGQVLAVAVLNINATNGQVHGHSAAPSASSVLVPLVQSQNNGYSTGFAVQNAGTGAADITVTYTPNQVPGGGQPANESYMINVGEVGTVSQQGQQPQNDWNAIGRYVGSAKVTSNGAPVAVAVKVQNTNEPDKVLSYRGVPSTQVSNQVVMPLIQSNKLENTYTNFSVLNVGSDFSAVTCNYTSDGTIKLNQDIFGLPLNGSTRVLTQWGSPGVASGANDWNQHASYDGAAICTSGSGNQIVAIANQAGEEGLPRITYIYNAASTTHTNDIYVSPMSEEISRSMAPLASGAIQNGGTITYTYEISNTTPFRITDMAVQVSLGSVTLSDDRVEPGESLVLTGTYTLNAADLMEVGPLVNEVSMMGKLSNGTTISATTYARLGLYHLYPVNPAGSQTIDFVGDSVSVDVPAGAIPAGGAYLRYAPHGTEPFETRGDGLPRSTGNFVLAFNLALLDSSEAVIADAAFSPPLDVTLTYFQTVVDDYLLEENQLLVVYFDKTQSKWVTVDQITRDLSANQINFKLDSLKGITEFGIYDGGEVPLPYDPLVVGLTVYLPLVVR